MEYPEEYVKEMESLTNFYETEPLIPEIPGHPMEEIIEAAVRRALEQDGTGPLITVQERIQKAAEEIYNELYNRECVGKTEGLGNERS